MTSTKKKQLENRSIFCGPTKKRPKKRGPRKPKKPKVEQKDEQGADIPPEVGLQHLVSWINIDATKESGRNYTHRFLNKENCIIFPETRDLQSNIIMLEKIIHTDF